MSHTGEAIPPDNVCVWSLAVQDMKMFGSPQASTCADICLKLSLLFSPAVPHFICLSALGFHADDEGPRCSAMRCSSNPPFFLTLGKLLTAVWLPWDGAVSEHENKMLNSASSRRYKSPYGYFYESCPSFILAGDLALSRVFAVTFICELRFSQGWGLKLKKEMFYFNCHLTSCVLYLQ